MQTITTNIEDNKQVTLHYKDFDRFLRDEKIVNLANIYIKKELAKIKEESAKPSCPEEITLIQQYIKNYRFAIHDYNQLKHEVFDDGYFVENNGKNIWQKINQSKKNALLDALEAKEAASLPWGFKWLAAYWVENYTGFYTKTWMNDSIDVVKPMVEERLKTMALYKLNHHVYNFSQIKHERQKFCKNLLPMIEDRDEFITRLKKENDRDTYIPTCGKDRTLEIATLLDRIAK